MRTYSPGANFEAPARGRAGVFRFVATRGLLFFMVASSVPNREGWVPGHPPAASPNFASRVLIRSLTPLARAAAPYVPSAWRCGMVSM